MSPEPETSNPRNLHELAVLIVDTVLNVEPDLGLTADGWDEARSVVESTLVEFCQLQGWVKTDC